MAEPFFEPIREAIETQFNSFWGANGGGVPVHYDNVKFTQPADSRWVRLTIQQADGFQASIGDRQLEKQEGLIEVQVFTALNSGTKSARQLGDLAAEAFRWRNLTVGSVRLTCRSPRFRRAGDRASVAQWNLTIPFEARKVITRP